MTSMRIERLAMLPRQLAVVVRAAGEEGLDMAPGGEWTIRTNLAHLRDEETLVFRLRLERMLSEEAPVFATFPPELWLQNRDRTRDGTQELLRDFALQRQASVNILQRLAPEEWERKGTHPDHGEYTVSTWLDYWLNHDADHLRTIERLLQSTKRP